MRFLRRVRRVSASSFGNSAGMSHSSLRRRPPRPPLPFALTSLTLASRSSSACLALVLIAAGLAGLVALAGVAVALDADAFVGTDLRALAAALARSGCFLAGARLASAAVRDLAGRADFAAAREAGFASFSRRTTDAFFLAALTVFTL